MFLRLAPEPKTAEAAAEEVVLAADEAEAGVAATGEAEAVTKSL